MTQETTTLTQVTLSETPSPQDSFYIPPIPEGLPEHLKEISQLYSLLIHTEEVGKSREHAAGLMKKCIQLCGEYATLYEVSTKVTSTTCDYYFTKSKEERTSNQKASSLEALRQLDALMKDRIGREVFNVPTSIVPNFLESTSHIDGELEQLKKELKEMMKQVEDPKSTFDVDSLKRALHEKTKEYENYVLRLDQLRSPINESTQGLDQVVETTRKQYANSLISLDVCSWELKQIDLLSSLLKELSLLNQQLNDVKQGVEAIKKHLREHPFENKDIAKLNAHLCLEKRGNETLENVSAALLTLLQEYPASARPGPKLRLEALLKDNKGSTVESGKVQIVTVLDQFPSSSFDEAKKQFSEIIKNYSIYLEKAQQWKVQAEKEMLILQESLQSGGKKLEETIQEIPFHDAKVFDQVNLHQLHSAGSIKEERENVLLKLETVWHAIKAQLQTDTYDHLFYEVNRIGYAVFENKGLIPRDSYYKVIGIGWSITEKYVENLL